MNGGKRVGWTGGALLAACYLLLLGGPPSWAKAGSSRPPAGLYRGTISDGEGDPSTYSASLRVFAGRVVVGRRAGRVSYRATEDDGAARSGLDCRGFLTYVGRVAAGYGFRETIVGGDDAECVNGGVVTLTRSGGRALDYLWTAQEGQPRSASGALTRRK